MRNRLIAPALAAFLICVGIGAARATYSTDCVWSFWDSTFAYDAPSNAFVMTYKGTCSGGDVGCCVKFVTDLLYSQTGGFYSQQSHKESQGAAWGCSDVIQNKSFTVVCPTSPSGFYKLTCKVETCGGVVLKDYGSVVHQVP